MKITITTEIFDDPELCNKPGTIDNCKWWVYGGGLTGSQCGIFRRSLKTEDTPWKIGEIRICGMGAFDTNKIIHKCLECKAHYTMNIEIEKAKKYHEANDPQFRIIIKGEKSDV